MNRAASNVVNILDRPLGGRGGRTSTDQTVVSLSMFAYLYSEIVQYHQNRVDSISELERRLEATGYTVGLRILELLAYRAKEYKRETRLMNLLQFVSTTVWKSLFGKPADSLERSLDHPDQYMILDYTPITSTFTCVPTDFGGLSTDAYISGMIAGILEGAGFPARVTAHSVALEDGEAVPPSSTTSGGNSSNVNASGVGGGVGIGGTSSSSTSAPPSGNAAFASLGGGGFLNLPPRKEKAVFLVKFQQSVLTRDASMG